MASGVDPLRSEGKEDNDCCEVKSQAGGLHVACHCTVPWVGRLMQCGISRLRRINDGEVRQWDAIWGTTMAEVIHNNTSTRLVAMV